MTRADAAQRAKELANTNILRLTRNEIKEIHKELNSLFKKFNLKWCEVVTA